MREFRPLCLYSHGVSGSKIRQERLGEFYCLEIEPHAIDGSLHIMKNGTDLGIGSLLFYIKIYIKRQESKAVVFSISDMSAKRNLED